MLYRFINEYANHIKKECSAADIPEAVKTECTQNINACLVYAKRELVTVSECMEMLLNEEKFIHDFSWKTGNTL